MSRLGVRLVVVLFFLLSVPLSAETLAELFQKAKAQVKNQSWHEALTTLDQLDVESARPGNETTRQQLVAPIAFYRGVCEANLDQAEKAEADFATFLQANPGSTIDKVVYSKKAVAAFEAAGKDAASHGSLSLLQRYEEFKAPPNLGEKPDERWADGPVKWIMTADETAAWGALTSGAERGEFVERFWEARNPKPGSEDNPARTGFDRRIAFADAYFQLDEKKRGSLTDPGMVFVLLGPPTRTGRKPIQAGEDRSISDGMSNDAKWWMANRNSVHPDPTSANDPSNSFREIWHYRREALPKGVSIYELDVVFVTKKGYGRFVLQRDPAVLAALEAARSEVPGTRAAGVRPAAARPRGQS
jgi:GWxTD domain-containing protein